jgi:hypothetical protein
MPDTSRILPILLSHSSPPPPCFDHNPTTGQLPAQPAASVIAQRSDQNRHEAHSFPSPLIPFALWQTILNALSNLITDIITLGSPLPVSIQRISVCDVTRSLLPDQSHIQAVSIDLIDTQTNPSGDVEFEHRTG